MQNIFKRAFALTALICSLCIVLSAQTIDTTGVGGFDPAKDLGAMQGLLQWYNLLYGGLVIIWGFVAKAVGLKTKFPQFVFVIVAGGAVLAAAFVALGFSKVFPLVFSFLSAIGLYDIIFKPIMKKPDPVKS